MLYTRVELRRMADGLLQTPPTGIAWCVEFVIAESRGVGHGRHRALMCRRLKHVPVEPTDAARIVDRIGERLQSGLYSEQFRDQLRLALHLDRTSLLAVARECADHPRAHVQRQARWVLAHHSRG